MTSQQDIYKFVNDNCDNPFNWLIFEITRMLMDVEKMADLVEIVQDSPTTLHDFRNFLLHKNKIKTNRLWKKPTIAIKLELFDQINELFEKSKQFDVVSYEWCVVLSCYGDYLVKNNLKWFVSNFPSFLNLPQFFNLLHFCSKNIKLSNVKILKLLNLSNNDGELSELDDITYNICQQSTNSEIPQEYDLHHLCSQLVAIVKVKNIDEITEFQELVLPRILSYSPRIINTIILIMANISEYKQKTNYFVDLLKILVKINPKTYNYTTYFDCSLKLTKRKKRCISISENNEYDQLN